MGQTVLASQSALRGMSIGDYVSVTGSVVGGGWLYADGVEISGDAYVPGATPVMLVGIPRQFDRAFGTARVGDLTIDYTAALSRGDVPGDSVLVFEGIQPAKNGVMVSDFVHQAK